MKQGRIYNFQFNEIKLNEVEEMNLTNDNGIEQVQLLRVGKFNHALFGEFEITPAILRSLKRNFELGVRRVDLAVDYFHESNKVAAGWIQKVELREDDTQLWIEVEWTKNGRQRLEERELRYISAEFDFNYADSETGIKHGPTLLGAGLTNRPHVKKMTPILEENEPKYQENIMDFEQMLEAIKKMSPDQKKQIMEMLALEKGPEDKEMEEEKKMGDKELKEELEEHKDDKGEEDMKLSEELKQKEKEIADLKAANEKMKKEAEFSVMLSEGKVNPSQKEAYINGDFAKFVENAKNVNLDEKGSGADKKEEKSLNKEEAEDKLIALAEEKASKENKEFDICLSDVLRENRDLAKIAERV